MLLTREQFRDGVFARDGHRCVICPAPAADAHHIIERRLFDDGSHGYYLDNGASLCAEHHLRAEQTTLSCEEIRAAAGITRVVLPPQLYGDAAYDKWGNPILPGGRRMRGELFDDESVQKILGRGGVLGLFTTKVKYPQTPHLPWSPGVQKEDGVLKDVSVFAGRRVVVTVKRDGENTSLYRDGLHARSVDGSSHPSQSWVKAFHASIAHEIPDGWRVCGENLYATHTIRYAGLRSYFEVFSIWDDSNTCLSWEETVEWCELLGLTLVPVLYYGEWDEDLVRSLYRPECEGDPCEGYVVRPADRFHYREFRRTVAKYVAAEFASSRNAGKHDWRRRPVAPNGLLSAAGRAG